MKCGLSVRTQFPGLDASPPRCAQLMGFASRGCLVLVLGATAERRNLLFRSDLGLPWIRAVGLRLRRYSNSEMSWAECSTGISPPTITNSCPRACSAGSTASTPISPDIHEQIEARLAPFMWKTILDTRVASPRRASRSTSRTPHPAAHPCPRYADRSTATLPRHAAPPT